MNDFNPAERDLYRFERPQPKWWHGLLPQIVPLSVLVVDLSHYNANGAVDFQKLRDSGVHGVILKCSESDWYKDTTFDRNWQAALDYDLPVMAYHFFRGNKPADVQFSWFMSCAEQFLDEVDGKTAIVLDVETVDGVDKDTRASRFFAFAKMIRDEGLKDGAYCSPGLVPTLFPANDTRWNALTWQWVAHWTSASDYTLPNGWSRDLVKCWQYGIYPTYPWAERVDGAGTVDVNRMFFPSEEELKRWLGQSSQPAVYPFMVRVVNDLVVCDAPAAWDDPYFVIPQDTGLTVYGALPDDDDNLWYYIGSGWIEAGKVEQV